MERHAQKDKEAGGEGLGVLVTRKRCWRDENGNITTKRPAFSVAAIGKALEARRQQRGDSGDESGSGSGGDNAGGPISPPYSSGSSGRTRSEGGNIHDLSRVLDGFAQFQHQGQLEMQLQDMSNDGFPAIIAPVPQPEYQIDPLQDATTSAVDEILASCQADFDDIFSPDTAQSFNMPFTTLDNYNWLFEELRAPENSQGNLNISFDQGLVVDQSQANMSMVVESVYDNNSGVLPSPVNEHEFLNFEVKAPLQQQQQFAQQSFHSVEQQQLGQRSAEVNPAQQVYFSNRLISAISPVSENSNITTARRTRSSQNSGNPHSQQNTHITTSLTKYSHVSLNSSGSNCTPPTSIPEPTASPQHQLPEIDEVARQQVLGLIIQATTSPATRESQFSWDDPLLSLSALQNYSDLFFSRFNPAYPLIHRQSFDPSSMDTLLLVSVLMLGATYGGKDAHQMAVRVHNVLRGVLVSVSFRQLRPRLFSWSGGAQLMAKSESSRIISMRHPSFGCYRRCY